MRGRVGAPPVRGASAEGAVPDLAEPSRRVQRTVGGQRQHVQVAFTRE